MLRADCEFYTFGFHEFPDRFTGFLVFAADDLGRFFNDRDLASETREHLPKFKPDIAATKHEQMFRNAFLFEMTQANTQRPRLCLHDIFRQEIIALPYHTYFPVNAQ